MQVPKCQMSITEYAVSEQNPVRISHRIYNIAVQELYSLKTYEIFINTPIRNRQIIPFGYCL